MKTSSLKITFATGAVAALALFTAGCTSSTSSLPRVTYPVTYDIPVSSTRVQGDAGLQSLEVAAAQRVSVVPRTRIYYRVQAPVDVTLNIYDVPGSGARRTLATSQGTSFTSSLVPDTAELQFVFQPTQSNSGGTIKFTLSDQPLAAAVSSN